MLEGGDDTEAAVVGGKGWREGLVKALGRRDGVDVPFRDDPGVEVSSHRDQKRGRHGSKE